MSGTPITPERKERFLAALREMPNVTRASSIIGAHRRTMHQLKANDPVFAEQWDDAIEDGIANAEAMVHRRAFGGADKPLTHQGQFTYKRDFTAIDPATGERFAPHLAPLLRDADGNLVPETVKEYSDQLAMFLLKAHRPDRYRERITSDVNLNDATLTDAEREERVKKLLAEALQRKLAKPDDGSDLV